MVLETEIDIEKSSVWWIVAEIKIFVHTSAVTILDFAIRHSLYIFGEFQHGSLFVIAYIHISSNFRNVNPNISSWILWAQNYQLAII